MATYKLGQIFSSVQDSNYPYLLPELVVTGGDTTRVIVKTENLSDEELYGFRLFVDTLGIDLSQLNNLGMSSFQNDVFKGYCPTFFGVRDGMMGLLIGVQNEKHDLTDLFVECEVRKETVRRGSKEVEEFKYFLNDTEIDIKEYEDNDGRGIGKFYIIVKGYDEKRYEDAFFTLPFLLDKSKEYTSLDINKAWKTGEFQSLIREFGTGTSRLWIESNKAFTPRFKDKTFPKDGVLLLVRNGNFKLTPAGTYVGVESDICQTDWEIIESSHPELMIQYKNKDKVMDTVTLQDATNIQFTAAKTNNEGYHFVLNNGYPTNDSKERILYDNAALIHIVRPAKTAEHSPVNTCTSLYIRAVDKVKLYPHLLEAFKAVSQEFIGSPFVSLPSIAVIETETKALEAAKESLHGEFPKAANQELVAVTTVVTQIEPEEDGIPF